MIAKKIIYLIEKNRIVANPAQAHRASVRYLSLVFAPILLAALLIFPVTAATNYNGVFYWANITPQNDLYELLVYPGDTLLQDRSYDFTNVYGYSGQFAHWNNWKTAFTNCNPDSIVNISYIKTKGTTNPKNVYLDSSIWTTGDWYQWDGCFNQYEKGQTEPNMVPYSNDNAKMFTVINYSRDMTTIQNWQNALLSGKFAQDGIRGSPIKTDNTTQEQNISRISTVTIRGT